MSYIFPKLEDEKEFEKLVRDLFKRKTKNPNFQIYGRKGQDQYGIDCFGYDYTNKEFVVVQCKNYTKENYSDLQEKIKGAYNLFNKGLFNKGKSPYFKKLPFYDEVNKFYYATSANKHNTLQDFQVINSQSIPLEIMFWEDIVDELSKYEDLMYKYFTKNLPTDKKQNIIIDDQLNKKTCTFSYNELNQLDVRDIIGNIKSQYLIQEDQDEYSYLLSIGFFGFKSKEAKFLNQCDLQVDFSDFFQTNDSKNWEEAIYSIKTLANKIQEINKKIPVKQIFILQSVQPCLSILIGFVLKSRLDKDIKFYFKFKDTILSNKSEDLVYSNPSIKEDRININSEGSQTDIAIIFNGTKNKITYEQLKGKNCFQKINPYYIFTFNSEFIKNTANAFTKATFLKDKLIDIINTYRISNNRFTLHCFFIAPDQFCSLVGTMLDRFNGDIALYYQSSSSSDYILAGKINNEITQS